MNLLTIINRTNNKKTSKKRTFCSIFGTIDLRLFKLSNDNDDQMPDLNAYFYFVTVVEKRGFSAAARALDIPKSRLSRHIRKLEERLDVRLIQRNSRQFFVTDVGKLFYQHARAMIDEMEKAESSVNESKHSLSGQVTLSCSVGVAQFVVKQILTRFLIEHPGIQLIQHVGNQSVDLIAQGIDLAVRGHNNPLPDSSLIQRHLAKIPWFLFAAPTYLDDRGRPEKPDDLYKHDGLQIGWQPRTGQWSLENDDGEKQVIPFSPRLCSDDMSTLREAATYGLGIVALPGYTCQSELENGALIHVLPKWKAANAELSLIMPSRKGISPAARALADFLLREVDATVSLKSC